VTLVTGPVAVIKTKTNAVVTTVDVGGGVSSPVGALAVDPTGTSVHVPVAAIFNEHVSVISTATNTELTTIPPGSLYLPKRNRFCRNDARADQQRSM